MAFTLDSIVPWGRSFEEYVRMFALSEDDLTLKILGCADGPASFNCEATERCSRVISCDPIYLFSAKKISERIEKTYQKVMDQVERNRDDYIWKSIKTPRELGQIRAMAMRKFLDDYPADKKNERYCAASLPFLPFRAGHFDLALCSHFLFSYSAHLSLAFHQAAILELCRVARQVRIFPLLNIDGRQSPYVDKIARQLKDAGLYLEFCHVPYEFQKGGNRMMRIVGI